MKTLYKYVDFGEKFLHHKPGELDVEYIKANHNRGYWIQLSTGKKVYKKFQKSDIVNTDIPETSLTNYMKVK